MHKIEEDEKKNGWNDSSPQDSETVIAATQGIKKKKTWQCVCVWRARSTKNKSKTSERERLRERETERAVGAAPASVNSNQ